MTRYIIEEYRNGHWAKVSTSYSLTRVVNAAVQLAYRLGRSGYPYPTLRTVTEDALHPETTSADR